MAPQAFVLDPKLCPLWAPRATRKPLFGSISLEGKKKITFITPFHSLLIHFGMPLNLNVSQH